MSSAKANRSRLVNLPGHDCRWPDCQDRQKMTHGLMPVTPLADVYYTPCNLRPDDWRHGLCYVAGPMTGYDSFNYQAFDDARDQLVSEGWDVISPADLDRINIGIDFSAMTGKEDLSEHIHQFARQDITSLLCVQAVFLLPGWTHSTGAQNEMRIATMLGVPCFDYITREQVFADARFSNSGNA